MYKGPMEKAKGVKDEGWEVGVAGVGERGGGRGMETTTLGQT